MTQESNNRTPQDRAAAAPSHQPLVRAEGPQSLLPGAAGLTPLADSAHAQPAGGWRARAWSTRRWWLTPVFTLLGAAAAAQPFLQTPTPIVQPRHTAHALVRYESTGTVPGIGIGLGAGPQRPHGGKEFADIVRTELQLLAEPQGCALAARSVELQRALPWLKRQDLDDPAAQRGIARRLQPLFTATLVPSTELVRIESSADDRAMAAAVCNAFADALIERCLAHIPRAAEVDDKPILARIKELESRKQKLVEEANLTEIDRQQAVAARQAETFTAMKSKAADSRTSAIARLDRLGQESADGIVEQFARRKQQRLEEEKVRDPLYQQAFKDQVNSAKDYAAERGAGKTEQHRDVILAADRMHRAETMAARRAGELSAAVDAALAREQSAAIADAKAEAAEAVKIAEQQTGEFDKKLAEWEDKAKALGAERARRESMRAQIDQVNLDLERENKRYEQLLDALAKAKSQPVFTMQIVRRAEVEPASKPAITDPPTPRRKITMTSISVGGGFCIGLALTFITGALRAPRRQATPIAQILGGPLLGSIPLAASMKRSTEAQQKAAQLRIAEGFRHLRNSFLVQIGPIQPGEPHTLNVASAHRGQGRSCVAVGLAVSLAKAGRRVLLVDADLRKPDLHRIFSLFVLALFFCHLFAAGLSGPLRVDRGKSRSRQRHPPNRYHPFEPASRRRCIGRSGRASRLAGNWQLPVGTGQTLRSRHHRLRAAAGNRRRASTHRMRDRRAGGGRPHGRSRRGGACAGHAAVEESEAGGGGDEPGMSRI